MYGSLRAALQYLGGIFGGDLSARVLRFSLGLSLGLASGLWAVPPASAEDSASGVGPGQTLPAFSAELLDGGVVNQDTLAGRPALILFWATWCPYCKRLMPGIQRTFERYGDAGLQVLGVSFREDGNVQAYRRELGLSFDIAVQGDAAAAAFGVRDTPTWFFVDADGVVRFRGTSSDPDDPVLDLIAADLLGIDAEDCATALC